MCDGQEMVNTTFFTIVCNIELTYFQLVFDLFFTLLETIFNAHIKHFLPTNKYMSTYFYNVLPKSFSIYSQILL